jgi:NAD(P)-dependent dehydrogenase (short-subunit alcohol dehydrogenase family)
MNLFDLSKEVAAVIGATGVLGGSIAEGLAAAGAHVVVMGRNAERGKARVDAIHRAGGRACFVECDATSRAGVASARAAAEAAAGPVSVLVNAAGGNDPRATVAGDKKFEDIALEDWHSVLDMNLVGGAFLPCQEFGAAMVARRHGSIINIASVAAHIPVSRGVTYSAAKAAVLNLTQFLAREWAPHGVRVNSITPGFFPAEQNRRLLFNDDGTPTDRARTILAHTGMGRFGEARELVGAAVFLASAAASGFVTGTDLRVDGGFLSQTI